MYKEVLNLDEHLRYESEVLEKLFDAKDRYPSFNDIIDFEMNNLLNQDSVLEPSFLRRGIYNEQIERYLKYFDRKQLLILDFEDLKNDTISTLRRTFDYLDIPTSRYLENIDISPINRGKYEPKIESDTLIKLKNFYKPHNKKLEQLLNVKLNW